jgi:hypothetical protein
MIALYEKFYQKVWMRNLFGKAWPKTLGTVTAIFAPYLFIFQNAL